MAPVFNVAVLVYPECDILDFAGPLEVYAIHPPTNGGKFFKSTTFACQTPVKIAEGQMTLVPDATLQEIDDNLGNYDIIVVPGAMPERLDELIASEDGKAITNLLKKFASLPPREVTGHRVLQSVCSGAFLLAATGILANRTVTTHHTCYEHLKKIADKAAGGESHANVVRKRWVDAGKTDAGVRIINAGGVTSGIDCSLFLVEELIGKKNADWAAEILEFERRRQEDGWGV
jgi:transcriptional regulator GlxA family with amidase domain